MNIPWALTSGVMCVWLLAGCGRGTKESEPSSTSQTQQGGNPLTAPVDYLGAVNQANKSANSTLELAQVQKAIQEYKILEGQFPASMQALVDAGLLAKLPAEPRGMRFVYNPQTGQAGFVRQ